MLFQFFSIGLIMLVSVMSPGPDFALVAKNTIMYTRRIGLYTSLGIVLAVVVHMTYCLLGLAVVIANSLVLFTVIKYIGALYLIYVGVCALRSSKQDVAVNVPDHVKRKKELSSWVAVQQGFLCNLLNPKATLFFLALFTVIIKPGTPLLIQAVYAVEMFTLAAIWFTTLTFMLSHPRILSVFNRVEVVIERSLGVLLIVFGIALVFVKR